MAVRRFACVVTLLTLAGLLAPAGPARAQAKKDKKNEDNKEAVAALMKLIEEAAKAKNVRKDQRLGNGTTPYDEAPGKPGLLVGFDLYPGVRGASTQYVRGVRALYLTNDNKTLFGSTRGWVKGGAVRVEAKKGYAVAGLKVNTNFGEISGLAIVFAKMTATGLDMEDTYESKYWGHKDPDQAKTVGCTGEPIVGIHGMIADNARDNDFGLGLIILGKKDKDKEK